MGLGYYIDIASLLHAALKTGTVNHGTVIAPSASVNVLAGFPEVWENTAAHRYLAMQIGEPELLCNRPGN